MMRASSDLLSNLKLSRNPPPPSVLPWLSHLAVTRSTHVPQLLHQRGQQAAGDELLNLLAGSGGDVGQRPGCLLLHAGLGVPHQWGQDLQDPGIHGHLGLQVRAAHHVPDGAQRRGLEKIQVGQSPEGLPGRGGGDQNHLGGATRTPSSLCLMSSTSRDTMPVFTTTSMRSLSPSER